MAKDRPDRKRAKSGRQSQEVGGERSKHRQARKFAFPDPGLLELAAHDLKNPLSGILTASQFLIEDAAGVLNPDQLILLRSIQSSAEFMLRLLDDMAELPQLGAGSPKLDWRTTDVGLLLEHVVAVIRPLAENRRISIDVRIEPPLSTIRADPVKLSRSLEMLLTHTIRSSQPDGRIEFQVAVADRKAAITLRHEDASHSSDVLRSLFDRSLARKSKRKFAQERAALTLGFVQRIVEAHHGTVQLAVDPKGKSSVVITIPVSGSGKLRARKGTKSGRGGQSTGE